MDVKHYNNAADFLARAGKFLVSDEARYGLITGIANKVLVKPDYYGPETPWFCTVSADPKPEARLGSEMYAAAWRTPPFMVGVVHFSGSIDTIAAELVTAVTQKFKDVPGVVGDKALADRFAARWCGKYGTRIKKTQQQRLYKLTRVNSIPEAPGKIRLATEADQELVTEWGHGFHIDCFGPDSNTPEDDFSGAIREKRLFIWEDGGRPVSMALKTRGTDNSMAVAGVYTPPELRKKGYATSCVAEVSRGILQSGKLFCTLYTDLANPISNSIYKKIGYIEVCDSVQHDFEKKG